MKTKEKRFDHLLREAISYHARMIKQSNDHVGLVQRLRRTAYKFAVTVLELRKDWHNEFLAFCETNKMSVDEWMDQHFEPIEQMGDDRRNLLTMIEEGMTEAEYVRQFRMWGVKKRASDKPTTAIAHADLKAESAITERLSDAEQATYYKKQYGAVVSELRQLRRDLATTLDELDRFKKGYERMERAIKVKAKKSA